MLTCLQRSSGNQLSDITILSASDIFADDLQYLFQSLDCHMYNMNYCSANYRYVHPSVTSQCSAKTAEHRIMQKTPHDSPETSFQTPKILAKFERGHPQWGCGCQMEVGVRLKLATFDK